MDSPFTHSHGPHTFKSNVRDKLRDSPIWERLGGDLLFLSLPALLDHLCGRGKWCGADNATTGGGNGGRQEQSQKTEGGEGQQVSVDDQQQFEAGEQEQGEQGFDGYADWDT